MFSYYLQVELKAFRTLRYESLLVSRKKIMLVIISFKREKTSKSFEIIISIEIKEEKTHRIIQFW